jgi:hypothetical protein
MYKSSAKALQKSAAFKDTFKEILFSSQLCIAHSFANVAMCCFLLLIFLDSKLSERELLRRSLYALPSNLSLQYNIFYTMALCLCPERQYCYITMDPEICKSENKFGFHELSL